MHAPSLDHTIEQALAESLRAALSERDGYLLGHGERVARLSVALGRACAMSQRELGLLEMAASLHDVGKIGIPDAILAKPGRLDEHEHAVMRSHCVRGERILAAVALPGMRQLARVARQHHEDFDGGGYPDGLVGEAIEPMARIVALADSYDAMASARSYHPPVAHAEAVQRLRAEVGRRYDPWLYARFEPLLDRLGAPA